MGISITPPGPADPFTPAASLTANGAVTAPGAGQVLANITSPPAGLYRALCYVKIAGVITAAEQNNVKLVVSGATKMIIPIDPIADNSQVPGPVECNFLQAAANVSLQAVGAGGAGAIYLVTLVITQIG